MDIVERFRKQQQICEQKSPPFIPDYEWLNWGDAADEIERLREALRLMLDNDRNLQKPLEELFAEFCTEARKALREKE